MKDENSILLRNFAWASGIFEGEGWISINGYNPRLGIQSSDKEVLDKFHEIVGLGTVSYRKPRIYSYEKIKTRKPQWTWRVCSFEDVQAALAILWFGLSSRRKQRAKEVLLAAQQGGKRTRTYTPPQESPVKCGSVRKYWQGCRCKKCRIAERKYQKKNRQLVEELCGTTKAKRTKHKKSNVKTKRSKGTSS